MVNDNGSPAEEHEVDRLKSKHKKWNTVSFIVWMFLLGGLVGVSLLYYSSANTVADQDEEIASLQERIRPGKAEAPADDTTETVEEQPPAQTVQTSDCSGGAEYVASVGKFTLKLADPHVVIRTVDGGAEGGPVTSLSVGRCVAGEKNVVDAQEFVGVEILGHPNSPAADLKSSFESQSGSLTDTGPDITIDGVTAKTYPVPSIGPRNVTFFDKNGIGYQVVWNAETTSNPILTDVISDWKFTP